MRSRLAKGLERRLRAMPWQFADRVARIGWIDAARTRRYRAALDRHRGALPILDADRRTWLRDLCGQGCAIGHLDAMPRPAGAAMFAAARQVLGDCLDDLRRRDTGNSHLLMVPTAALAARPEIYRFGLHPYLLDLVEAYIGLPVAYDGVTLQYTPADGLAHSTRAWHRDREDRRMVKIAVYLNDVDAAGGPFQLLPLAHPASVMAGVRGGFHLADDIDAITVGAARPISCEGPAGTVVIADTGSYFHRGKPATGAERAALFFSYFARTPQRPYFCARTGLSQQDIAAMVADLSPRQQAAASWQRALPPPWRFIPTAEM